MTDTRIDLKFVRTEFKVRLEFGSKNYIELSIKYVPKGYDIAGNKIRPLEAVVAGLLFLGEGVRQGRNSE